MDYTGCTKIIMIGGSAGSFPAIERILASLPETLRACIIIILHRPRNTLSEMANVLTMAGKHKVTEPEDKEEISDGKIFLVPQNYHMLAEQDGLLSLDYSEAELYSRPSINVIFESFGEIYRQRAAAIILSGLNNDGAEGMAAVVKNGGQGYIQHPGECEFTVMPEAAKTANPQTNYYTLHQLINIILNEVN